MGHHSVGVVDVCQENPLVDRDAEGRVVGVHVEAVDNGKMEVEDDVGKEDAYDCPFQDMYDCHENDFHV